MRTYAEIVAGAADRPAFSNGTEGYSWQRRWCDRCVHDKPIRSDDGKPDPATGILGCPVLATAMQALTPAEWIEQDPLSRSDRYHCVEFRDEDDPGPGEPQPIPDPPGQETLFERGPFEATRMLSPLPDTQAVRA